MKLLIAFAILGLSFASYAAGPGDGGGGDPMTQQFIVMGKKLALFYKANPFKAKLSFSADEFEKKIDLIDDSVKDETKKDLVEFTNQVVRNSDNTEKGASFNKPKSSILVNRDVWKNYNDEQRLTLITMEVTGFFAVPARYESALALVHDHAAMILSIPLDFYAGGKTNATEGWRIVGEDAKQFENITANDVMIDGGVLGKGDAVDARIGKFFADPTSDKEWFELVVKAWENQRPAYFMLTGPDGTTASITSFYLVKYDEDGDNGVSAYSLLFKKAQQIYEGVCAGEARTITALERLSNCYLNPDNYFAYDSLEEVHIPKPTTNPATFVAFRKVLNKLSDSMMYYFSYNKDVLQAAVRDNFIYNYTGLTTALYESDILVNSLRAHSLVPSLIGPFASSTFWIKDTKKNIAAIRIFAALQALAEHNLAFIDHGTVCGTDRGPKLLPIDNFRAYQRTNACSSTYTFVPRTVTEDLFPTMVAAGFYYQYDAQTWKFDANGVAK